MRHSVTVILVAIVVAASGHIALAQTSPAEGTKPEMERQGHRDDHGWASQRCSEHAARLAGRLAYLEVKLDLSAEQRPLWDKWRQAAMDGAMKVRAVCMERPAAAEARPTVVERAAHLQKMLATMAAALESAQPELAAVYQSLNDEQRDTFEKGMRPWHRHHHRDRPRHDSVNGAQSNDRSSDQ
jgi:hypothetical protein